ncbi:hypothetical protein M011DRAFT_522575 [Sporormia fimetaria CBS 119925]|uniref:Genetic interactor of prohibitins 3, mitochondrial n=1 Tax=Sporormia fimetaria CBS 119925 TaxID=1340428 RepID=A0A6A6UWK3_9PLEO|nr:hypothetical protein M011DRAFT_522575 [Sporormia fimetaria CBS 119925]
MRRALQQTRSLLEYEQHVAQSVPAFLCPALLRSPVKPRFRLSQKPQPFRQFSASGRVRTEQVAIQAEEHAPPPSTIPSLPRACPGCGAPSQVFDKEEAGYYDIDRKAVKAYLNYEEKELEMKQKTRENTVYTEALKNLDPAILQELALPAETPEELAEEQKPAASKGPQTPLCDRCHNLINHHVGTPILHPSLEAIRETIAESPHLYNHIYHVVDAADFPLSLVQNLSSALKIPRLRTQNRRAKHKGWMGKDRVAQVSFVITRADLLVPLKSQVDKLLPYMQEVLRDALGRSNQTARLGNVYLVSAQRGWWTKKVKEDIWERRGAGWMVGKVNVGKSSLFEVVFPKGRGSDHPDMPKIRAAAERETLSAAAKTFEELQRLQAEFAEEDAEMERYNREVASSKAKPEPAEEEPEADEDEDLDPDALLPPPQKYTPYPVLPLASHLPGTTASPIRIPFGRNRGELIDLPGLARTNPDLSTFVLPEHHSSLVMKSRVVPDRLSIRPGQSLLLGNGLIRITPSTPDLIFLAHAFVPLKPHITATEKAVGIQTQTRETGLDPILRPNVGEKMRSAGTFKLQWDATKKLAGPLTDPTAGKMKPENLPFTIYSADILIEGVGWVELSAQVRKPKGWKAVGMQKKDPNHARIEKEKRKEEERRRRQEKYEDKLAMELKERGGGDAFDQIRERERKRRTADEFVEEMMGPEFPEVEIFTPLGRYVGVRRPMCGSVLGGKQYVSSRERAARPRRPMAGARGKVQAVKKEKRREKSG